MYADDITYIYLLAASIEQLSTALDEELELVGKWVWTNKLALNLTKTHLFGSNSKFKFKP